MAEPPNPTPAPQKGDVACITPGSDSEYLIEDIIVRHMTAGPVTIAYCRNLETWKERQIRYESLHYVRKWEG